MKRLISIKFKLIFSILILVTAASVLTVTIGLNQGFKLTQNIIKTQFEDKVTSDVHMLETYLTEQFGKLSLSSDGKLNDKTGKPIDGRYDYIDKLSAEMGVVATVFSKNGDSYIRTLTTITNDKGERVVGTELDSQGNAYKEVTQGKTYLGEADILGNQYITCYLPILDASNQIIGIYFVGVPIEEVNTILNNGISSTVKSVVVFMVIILIIAAVVSILIALSIANPIKKITKAAQEIADGNFDVKLSIKSKDEVGQLAGSFSQTISRLTNYQGYIDELCEILSSVARGDLVIQMQKDYAGQFRKLKENLIAMLDNLNLTLYRINMAADQVDQGASQVSGGAQALAQGATEQASAIEELAATIAETKEQTVHNAGNAKAAHDKAEIAGKELSDSNKHMEDMVAAMNLINQKSSEISKIVKIIDDIAFQTNILALNAAVEAARAGSAGKGFAVVADEVRSLAGKSAEAVKNTTALISDTINAVENGSSIAEKTARSLSKSAELTSDAIVLIDKIARATDEQATSIAQINQALEQVSSVVQMNAATAEESAAASEVLSSQSDHLEQLISGFNLKESKKVLLEQESPIISHSRVRNLMLK